MFLIASGGYSFYISNFSSYSKTYGTLAGIIITLIWFWMLSFAVLLGAQINVEVAGRSLKAQEAARSAAEQAAAARLAELEAEPRRAAEFGERVMTWVEQELDKRFEKRGTQSDPDPQAPAEPSTDGSNEAPAEPSTGDSVSANARSETT